MVAFFLSLLLMVADHRHHHLESARSILALVVAPLHYAADFPVSAGRWFADLFSTRDQLREQNDDLQRQNLLLQAQLQKLEALEAENIRLRDLLKSSAKVSDRILIAELLAVDLDPYKQQIVINKGSSDGVFSGQPVLDAHAVMGQVVGVTPVTSTVLLITDPNHVLPVQVNRNGLRTIAFGSGQVNRLELPYLPNNADIQEGDLLVTSGLGGRFPPGYPVALAASVRREPGEPFATVSAVPSAHLERAREVLLVWTRTEHGDDSEEQAVVTENQALDGPGGRVP